MTTITRWAIVLLAATVIAGGAGVWYSWARTAAQPPGDRNGPTPPPSAAKDEPPKADGGKEPGEEATPRVLLKAATSRPRAWRGDEGYPILPALSTEMRARIGNEIASSAAVRRAFEKLDTDRKRNVDWFEGVADLEREKAVWGLLACLCHPSEDVQIHALRGLERLGDKRAVPFLLVYADYMAVLEEGSENATIHGVVHQSSAKTLSALTGVKVELNRGQDPQGLKQGVRRWRKWLVEEEEKAP